MFLNLKGKNGHPYNSHEVIEYPKMLYFKPFYIYFCTLVINTTNSTWLDCPILMSNIRKTAEKLPCSFSEINLQLF